LEFKDWLPLKNNEKNQIHVGSILIDLQREDVKAIPKKPKEKLRLGLPPQETISQILSKPRTHTHAQISSQGQNPGINLDMSGISKKQLNPGLSSDISYMGMLRSQHHSQSHPTLPLQRMQPSHLNSNHNLNGSNYNNQNGDINTNQIENDVTHSQSRIDTSPEFEEDFEEEEEYRLTEVSPPGENYQIPSHNTSNQHHNFEENPSYQNNYISNYSNMAPNIVFSQIMHPQRRDLQQIDDSLRSMDSYDQTTELNDIRQIQYDLNEENNSIFL
jgi:hypothetical protein